MKKAAKTLKAIALVLVIIGGLNWGLVGLFDFDVVATLFGAGIASKVIYSLIGLGALVMIFSYLKKKK